MLEDHYIHKPLHLINIEKVTHKASGIKATDILEVALINLETGGIVEPKDIIENCINSKSEDKSFKSEDFALYLKETNNYFGKPKGILFRFFNNREFVNKTEWEYYLVINNPLWVPILIKSIIVETPEYPEAHPEFKNIWTIPLNDNSELLLKHLYKRIKDRDCINNDIILVQLIDWKIGKLTDLNPNNNYKHLDS